MSDFALLIPVYNPPGNWQFQFAERYMEFRNNLSFDFSVWLINDGSLTSIQEGVDYLKETIGPGFNCLEYFPNKGKGAALKYAVDCVEAKFYMFTDIDFPYTTASMCEIYKTVVQRGGVVTGYREDAYYADLSPFRTILSKSLRLLNATLLGLPVNDTQCGLKAFDQEVKKILQSCNTDRFLIDLELLLAVSRKKLTITPVKVSLRDDTSFTVFNTMLLMKELKSFVGIIWKYRIR